MSLAIKNSGWPGLLLAILLLNCSGSRTLYDYDTKARFDRYETFSWLERGGNAPQLIQPVEEAIRSSINWHLEAAGLRLVDGEGDLQVTYHIGDKAPVDISPLGYAYWPGRWSYGGYTGGAVPFVFPRSALIIDLVDRRSSRLVWRGSTEQAVKSAAMEKQAARIEEAVAGILAFYPPRIYE